MLHTLPDAEAVLPENLTTGGEQLWHWVELGMCVPFYLLEVRSEAEGETIIRHILSADVRMVIHTANTPNDNVTLLSTKVLTPGYVNGTDGFALYTLNELWSPAEDDFSDLMFILEDVSMQRFTFRDNPADIETFKLLADLRSVGLNTDAD
ncbi:MAG: hypothetical protein C0607_11695 [Azoarcus sp.]|nr:MAG: hypothetical protein C0607_11695 [Azoarcus sp.]